MDALENRVAYFCAVLITIILLQGLQRSLFLVLARIVILQVRISVLTFPSVLIVLLVIDVYRPKSC